MTPQTILAPGVPWPYAGMAAATWTRSMQREEPDEPGLDRSKYTEWHWTQVASAICVALAIDEQGIVRGLRALHAAPEIPLAEQQAKRKKAKS